MTKFEITVDLIVEDCDLDAVPDYGNRQVSSYYCISKNELKWDVTLTNTVEAETAEDAADTITTELIERLTLVDPDWYAIIFQDDDEKIQLSRWGIYRFDELGYIEGDIDLSNSFKCCECGTKYEHSFCSTDDVSICRWCSGQEKEAGILE